jgi:hypothetical protein
MLGMKMVQKLELMLDRKQELMLENMLDKQLVHKLEIGRRNRC